MTPTMLVAAQRTAEWKAAREGRVTASVAAACLHLNPHRSARSAWREVMGCKTEAEAKFDAPDAPPHFGTLFEAPARLDYEALTGNWVEETGFWVNDDYPFLGASPDGLIGDDGLLEVKCPEYASLKVACRYRVQMQVQLVVTGRQWCDFWQWGWGDGKRYLERIRPLSQTGRAALLRRLREWYDKHVLGGEEPERKPARRRRKSILEVVESPEVGGGFPLPLDEIDEVPF